MTVLKITVEDEQAAMVKEILKHIDLIKNVEEEHLSETVAHEPQTPYQRLQAIQQEIGDKQLFKEIENPSVWQQKVRKEWERDF